MSQQLSSVRNRFTPGQRRRRVLKMERRRARGVIVAFPAKAPKVRRTRDVLKQLRDTAREAASKFLIALVERRERLMTRRTPRCPFINVKRTIAGDIAPKDTERAAALNPCAGRMRPRPMRRDQAKPDWVCGNCGRVWTDSGDINRGLRGWMEVFG